MKRLAYLISTFLILAGMYGGNVGADRILTVGCKSYGSGCYEVLAGKFNGNHMPDSHKQRYLKVIWEPIGSGWDAALAVAPNGWATGVSLRGTNFAKQTALKYCRIHIRSNSCKIVDVNGTSAFIKQRGSSGSTTTASNSSSGTIWCANTTSYWETTRSSCINSGGTVHTSQATARSSTFGYIWCAKSGSVTFTSEFTCRSSGGKPYSSKNLANAEHKRLKGVTNSVVKTASLTIRSNVNGDSVYIDGIYKGPTPSLNLKLSKGRHTIRIEKDGYKTYEESINLTDNRILRGHLVKIVEQPVQTVGVDNTAEIEFWKSVKDSTDPDMYREYLRQFPQGVYAGLAKLKVKKLGGTATSVAQSSIPNLDYGDYYALVIGNNRYDHLSDLRTAVNDARSVANTLELDYGFNVTTLENANRDQIINSISGLRSKVTSEDNVLIYYAGHGVLDEDADEGYWLPVDASRDNPANWVMTDQVISQVRAMKAKHVMVVADSCFSGTITRGIKIEQRTPEWLETIVKKKSRTALTSGGLEPVMDSGGGNHSVFANAFLSILRDNDGVLDASQLFSQLRPKVMVNSDQTPEYGDIHRAGHDGGDFLFVRQ